MKEKRTCSKSVECKVIKCIHHGEHTETEFCDETCETFTKAVCIKNKTLIEG